jgi:hypothetical protein
VASREVQHKQAGARRVRLRHNLDMEEPTFFENTQSLGINNCGGYIRIWGSCNKEGDGSFHASNMWSYSLQLCTANERCRQHEGVHPGGRNLGL